MKSTTVATNKPPRAPPKSMLSRKAATNFCVICRSQRELSEPVTFLPFVKHGGVCQGCLEEDIGQCKPCLNTIISAMKTLMIHREESGGYTFIKCHSKLILDEHTNEAYFADIHPRTYAEDVISRYFKQRQIDVETNQDTCWLDNLPENVRTMWTNKIQSLVIDHHMWEKNFHYCECRRFDGPGFQKCLQCNKGKCTPCGKQHPCKTCERKFCQICMYQCSGCSEYLNTNETKSAEKKNEYFCPDDVDRCSRCPRHFCKDCRDFVTCDYCKITICQFCQEDSIQTQSAKETFQPSEIVTLGMFYCDKKCLALHKESFIYENQYDIVNDSNSEGIFFFFLIFVYLPYLVVFGFFL